MLVPLTEDRAALPAALLPQAKAWMHVDTSDDDALIQSLLARVIARFQEENEVTVNPSSFAWTPRETDFCVTDDNTDAIDLPVRPVTAFVALADAVDVSADYLVGLKWDGVYGAPIQQLIGPKASLSITLTAGYADLTKLPDAVLDALLRWAGFLYDYRELALPDQALTAPDIARNATWWHPRI